MQQEFTKEYMLANCGCYSEEELMACSFMAGEVVTLSAIVHSEILLKDKFWFVCKKLTNLEENRQIAIDVATIVLPIFESRYPGDDRPRKAIEAAKEYIDGRIAREELAAAADAAAATEPIREQLFDYLLKITNA